MEILLEGLLDYGEGKEWKKRYVVMKYEISSALRYIEIYKDKNWRKQLPRHVVNLHPGYEVKQIRNDPKKKHSFSVKTTDHVLMLASDDENMAIQWMATLEEYNLVKSFCVQPHDTPTMARIEAIYPCHLQMVHSEVRLVSAMDGKLLGMWPFKCIRRYKFVGSVFCIEAGRKAPTGEGMFEFISNECAEIYRVMDTIIRTKAGNSTMRRLASEKIPDRVIEQHQILRKTKSHPHPTSTGELQYEYATTGSELPGTGSSPFNFPGSTTLPTLPEPDPHNNNYDVLSPGAAHSKEPPGLECSKQGTTTNRNSYDTLQSAEHTEDMKRGASGYDILVFDNYSGHTPQGQKESDQSYDTLQFSKLKKSGRNKSNSSVDDVPCSDNQTNQPENLKKSGSFYDTLSHFDTPEPLAATQQNTYESINSTPVTNTTYDCLGESKNPEKTTSLDLKNTYDQLNDSSKCPIPRKTTPTSEHVVADEKPAAPERPPPRKRGGKHLKDNSQVTKSVPERPSRLLKPSRKSPHEVTDEKDAPKPTARKETIRDIIQKKRINSAEDNGCYTEIDHDYASIDYSKVSSKSESLSSSAVYSEPLDVDRSSKPSPISFPKPIRPKRNHPKAMKNLFKKSNPSVPGAVKPKTPPVNEEEGSFADELKKKLESKLKKNKGTTSKDSGASSSKIPSSSQTHDDNTNNGIYDEVDYSQCSGYSEPVLNEMDI